MNDFHLREHVRRVLAVTPGENIEELVDVVFASTDPEDYAEAYHQALAPIIRVALAHAERPVPEAVQSSQSSLDTQNCPAGPDLNSDGEVAMALPTPNDDPPLPVGPNIRNSRAARLLRRNRFRESISIGSGVYRSILECTVADLEYAAAESEKLAAENDAAARRYRTLVKIMAENEAETVGELTEEQLEEVLGDE